MQLFLKNYKIRHFLLCLSYFSYKSGFSSLFQLYTQKWFKPRVCNQNTRQEKTKYFPVKAKHSRLDKSPISVLTMILNKYHRRKWKYNIFLQGELLLQRWKLPQTVVFVLLFWCFYSLLHITWKINLLSLLL